MTKYYSTKTYGPDLGLSACFRQWRAKSHCSKFHGYALSFKLVFSCTQLDENNWCLDFGSLKPVKQYLVDTYDHRLLVAQDDPHLKEIFDLDNFGIADVRVVHATGCEAFAMSAYYFVEQWLVTEGHSPRVKLESVEVREHGANSAIFEGF